MNTKSALDKLMDEIDINGLSKDTAAAAELRGQIYEALRLAEKVGRTAADMETVWALGLVGR